MYNIAEAGRKFVRPAQGWASWSLRLPQNQSESPSIRATLALLVVLCILPISLVAGLLLVNYYKHEQRQLSISVLNQAQSLMLAVDREFAATQAALQALSTSHRLATGDLEGFHNRAEEVLENVQADSIVVVDPSGQLLLSTHLPYGAPLPKLKDRTLLNQILETGKPGVSNLFTGPIVNRPIFTVGVPVKIANTTAYSLNATFTSKQIMAVLQAHGFPDSWRVVVMDSTGHIVARSRDLDKFLGKSVTPDLIDHMRQSNDDSFDSVTLDGVPVLTAFSASPVSHWCVAVGIPKAELTAGLRHTLLRLVFGTAAALGIGLWLAWFVGGRVARSITGLMQPAIELVSGEKLEIPPLHFKEANAMRSALLQASELLQQSRHDAHHDGLTGLPNRTLFHYSVAQQLALCQRNNKELCILFIDLDGFKAVNDTLGHAAGDQLLREVSQRMTRACRESDISARLGGDEFAVALIHSDLEHSRVFATQLVELISQPYMLGGCRAEVSASIGIAHFPSTATDVDTLLAKADHAMYQAKSTGKRRVCLAS
ncbi:diguanylate cyclase domain-containing protein [Comamonas guangdongensis]|uniref:Diguanylate cyclase n=1 Tax=Comamonas guangdongensis TaxID=510515 RepID=A0ABV3ZS63_9BURK